MASPSQNPGPRGRGSGFLGVEADAEEVLGLEPQVLTPLVLVGAPDGPLTETNEDPRRGSGGNGMGFFLTMARRVRSVSWPSSRSSMVAAPKRWIPRPDR